MRKLFIILLFIQSCRAHATEYDKLMNPLKQLKAYEKTAKKAPPVFDNVIEPDFPDEIENNKTLLGVDSNNDGVRDDIEIWINRNAEDEYVRQALKEAYRKEIKYYKSIANNEKKEVIHLEFSQISELWGCVSVLTNSYEKKYLEKYKIDPFIYYRDVVVNKFYGNTFLRKEQINKSEKMFLDGTVGGDYLSECPKYSFGKKFKEIVDSYKKKQL